MNIYRRRLRRLTDVLAVAARLAPLYAAALALDWQDKRDGAR